MSDIRVEPVGTRSDRKRFLAFPYELYKNERYWIPQLWIDQAKILNPKKNAFFQHGQIKAFLARKPDGEVVGRIAAIVNGQHLKKYDDGVGFFGFFEVREDYEIAQSLFDAAAGWLREQGLTAARGPANPSLNDIAGLLVGGFDRYPAIMMPYNMPFYAEYLERYGYKRVMTMWAYYIHLRYRDMDRLRRGVNIVRHRNPGLALRNLDMSRWNEETRLLLDIYNDAWSENWGHVPMTTAEFKQLAEEMKMVVDPRLIFIIEMDGEAIGFSLTLPDVNVWFSEIRDGKLFPTGIVKLLKQKFFTPITECRTVMVGIRPLYHGKGFDAVLNLAALDVPKIADYVGSEMSWILDDNKVMINAVEGVGGVRDKEYAMYEKQL